MSAATLPRPYYRILGASGLSNLADGIRLAAFPLLAANLTESAALVALVFVAGEAPWVVVGLWAGKIADQVDRRWLLQRVTLVRAVLLVALAGLIVVGAAPFWLVVAAAFVLGVAEVLADSVTGTLVPSVVPDHQLERANSRMVAAQITGNELVGPALGGLLFAVGAAVPFLANGTLLALALLLLAGLPLLQADVDAEADDGREDGAEPEAPPRLFDGIPFIRARPMLVAITWSSAVLAAVDAAWFALLVLFVREQLGFGPAGFGLSLAIGAVGGLAGAALADRIPDRPLSSISLVVFGTAGLSLIGLGLAPTTVMTMIALITTSGGFAVWNIYVVSARQRATPNHLLGRVGATYRTVAVSASLAGAIAGGFLADLFSIRAALVGYGLILVIAAPVVVAALHRVSRHPVGPPPPT